MFQQQVAVMSSLTKGCKSVEVVRTSAEVPEGCASQIITPEVAINIMVRGKIDIDAEVSKIQKKVDHIQGSAEKLKTLQASNSKLPAEVQAANVEKVRPPPLPPSDQHQLTSCHVTTSFASWRPRLRRFRAR